jgi:hypothetical protein
MARHGRGRERISTQRQVQQGGGMAEAWSLSLILSSDLLSFSIMITAKMHGRQFFCRINSTGIRRKKGKRLISAPQNL